MTYAVENTKFKFRANFTSGSGVTSVLFHFRFRVHFRLFLPPQNPFFRHFSYLYYNLKCNAVENDICRRK